MTAVSVEPTAATPYPPLGRDARARLVVLASAFLAVAAAWAALAAGAVLIPPAEVLRILLGGTADHALHGEVILALRLPRVIEGAAIGAALGVTGAAFQGLFRNPLADPGLIGIAAGAAVGAIAFIVAGAGFALTLGIPRHFGLPLAASLGAVATALLVYRCGQRDGALDIASLLLAGIAINALCLALSGFLVFGSDDQELRELTFWSMGSLARALAGAGDGTALAGPRRGRAVDPCPRPERLGAREAEAFISATASPCSRPASCSPAPSVSGLRSRWPA